MISFKQPGLAHCICHDCNAEWDAEGKMEWDAVDGVDHTYEDLFWPDGESKCPDCGSTNWGWADFYVAGRKVT